MTTETVGVSHTHSASKARGFTHTNAVASLFGVESQEQKLI
jgi:hypothetical protein